MKCIQESKPPQVKLDAHSQGDRAVPEKMPREVAQSRARGLGHCVHVDVSVHVVEGGVPTSFLPGGGRGSTTSGPLGGWEHQAGARHDLSRWGGGAWPSGTAAITTQVSWAPAKKRTLRSPRLSEPFSVRSGSKMTHTV